MSKQEILSWTSIGFTLSIVFFYVIIVFGWPDIIPDYSDRFTKIFVNVFWIALAVELIIGLSERKDKVNKDERDEIIEAKGHKYAYNFLTFMIVAILFQILLSNLLGNSNSSYALIGQPNMVFHTLFIILFTSSLIKRTTMIYHYRKDF